MRRLDAALLALFGLLALLLAAAAAQVAEHFEARGGLRLELGGERLATLAPDARALCESLDEDVRATLFVTGRARMPSAFRHVEGEVTTLLEALRAGSRGRFEYRVLDPTASTEVADLAARRGVVPTRVRNVTVDAWSERAIWSSLTLSVGAREERVLGGITPALLPRLQATIVAAIEQLSAPRAPLIALAAPEGFAELADLLATIGRVERVDLDGGASIPGDADVLLWMAPRGPDPARLRELEDFLARGKSALVAASELGTFAESLTELDGAPALALVETGFRADSFGSRFGLSPVGGLVLDERCDRVRFGESDFPAPFLLRCIAPNQDFRGWRDQPNGTLFFTAPTPLVVDPNVLAERGAFARVLATTSDRAWTQAAELARPGAPLALAAMDRASGTPRSKLPLIVEIVSDDPWRGRLVVAAATTPFEDGVLFAQGTAHQRLVELALGELASDERLVASRVGAAGGSALAELPVATRAAWRAFCIALPAMLLAIPLLLRGQRGAELERPRWTRSARPILGAGLALGLVLVLARLATLLPPSADLTRGNVNDLAPHTLELAREATRSAPVEIEVFVSSSASLPPDLRSRLPELDRVLDGLERAAGARLAIRRVPVLDLSSAERDALASEGIEEVRLTTRDEEVTTVRRVTCALRLTRAAQSTVVVLEDARAFDALEFRVAFALWKLETGAHPTIAFASDLPRLTAAEAYEQYQQKGLFAPGGADVHALARSLVERSGFRIAQIDPSSPELPEETALFLWLQPRRPSGAILERFVRHLVGGGKAMLALQLYRVRSEQHRGRAFEHVHWPEPQFPDVHQVYFPDLGLELRRDVLFDERSLALEVESQIGGLAERRGLARESSALPFQIRASSACFARGSTITKNLGDQAFVSPSLLVLDASKLAAHGLAVETLMTTSERTWTTDWSGGTLASESLAGPPRSGDGAPLFRGPAPLAVRVSGSFPVPSELLRLATDEPTPLERDSVPWPDPAAGELLLVACSDIFRDARLADPELRADRFLLQSVASLALPPELAEIAAHRPYASGLPWIDPDERLRWRAIVLGSGPLLVLLAGVAWRVARRLSKAVARTASGRILA